MNILRVFSRKISPFYTQKFQFSSASVPKVLTDEISLTEDCIKVFLFNSFHKK